MFKFIAGMLFAFALMNPFATKQLLGVAVDTVHNTSATMIQEAGKAVEANGQQLAEKD